MNSDDSTGEPILAPPWPAALAESLRGVGYSLPDAIADVTDNCISANAANVWIRFEWDGANSYISIIDDGHGMTSDEIVDAMRPGTRGPQVDRPAQDLGRFGLGLKTASFSQCRRLTVASLRRGSTVAAWRWDLDYLATSNDWFLLPGAAPRSENMLEPLRQRESGTAVVWEVMDRVVGKPAASDRRAQDSFLALIDGVEAHLAMVYHRYLEGPSPSLRIFINGTSENCRVRPWDPYLRWHPATFPTPEERIASDSGSIFLQGFVLPHQDRLDEKGFQSGAGIQGWAAHQGFFVYRNQRLLVAGSWLGLGDTRSWTKEQAYRLARLRLDLPNTADFAWKIDIKKSRATPPQAVRDRLTKLATLVRERARRVLAYRGAVPADRLTTTFVRAWTVGGAMGGAVHYTLNRAHPAIRHVLETVGDRKQGIEAMLRIIEQTVPVHRIWSDVAERIDSETRGEMAVDLDDLRAIMSAVFKDLVDSVNVSRNDALQMLLRMEPFQNHPDLVMQLGIETE